MSHRNRHMQRDLQIRGILNACPNVPSARNFLRNPIKEEVENQEETKIRFRFYVYLADVWPLTSVELAMRD